MSAAAVIEPGSFRDPGGRVFQAGETILRSVMDAAMENFAQASRGRRAAQARRSGQAGRLYRRHRAGFGAWHRTGPRAPRASAHPVHLLSLRMELQRCTRRRRCSISTCRSRCSQQGFTLSDATAYNVQFDRHPAGVHRPPVAAPLRRGRDLGGPPPVLHAVPQPAAAAGRCSTCSRTTGSAAASKASRPRTSPRCCRCASGSAGPC